MKSFEQFVLESAQQGHINLLFERGMYSLADDLERTLRLFAEARVPFAVIGGLAVNAYLMAASKRSRSFLTRHIDLLIRRSESVHMLFEGEKPKSSYPVENPDLNPERKDLLGFSIPVAPHEIF